MKLEPRERKLLVLAFDPAATPDEALAALRVLFRGWLLRYPDGHSLCKALEESEESRAGKFTRSHHHYSPYAYVVLGFGKHRGKCLKDIPPDYLIWILHNFEDLWPETREAIKRYLD